MDKNIVLGHILEIVSNHYNSIKISDDFLNNDEVIWLIGVTGLSYIKYDCRTQYDKPTFGYLYKNEFDKWFSNRREKILNEILK